MASKFEIYKNKSGEFRWRPIIRLGQGHRAGLIQLKNNASNEST